MRLLTAGESHGKGILVVIEGFPAGLSITPADINQELARRQKGYGRGGRMLIEKDQVEILSGIRKGVTLGSPVTFFVKNKDYENWEKIMAPEPSPDTVGHCLQRPRPGHADLPGGLKYNHHDLRNILERASARETTVRVAAGALAKKLLNEFNILVQSHVLQLGSAILSKKLSKYAGLNGLADRSPVRMLEKKAEKNAIALIDEAKKKATRWGVFLK